MPQPRFSILIPSRNRLSLLKLAVESVCAQRRADVEIVVSDNNSEEDYESFLNTVKDISIIYSRSRHSCSVTENWNRALESASGAYIIMLGDDDALAPNMLEKIDLLASKHSDPDCLYLMAYHYAYPNVFPDNPSGYLCEVSNSPLFDADAPYILDPALAKQHAVNGLRLHHSVSFNAQHFVWRRTFIEAGPRPFFQSPYPDYFACFTTMAAGRRILVVPSPEVFIGISKSSFGYYFANGREDEGMAHFVAPKVDVDALSGGSEEIAQALCFPGSQHYRNWFIAALFARKHVKPSEPFGHVVERYKTIQLYGIALDAGYTCKLKSSDVGKIGMKISKRDRSRLAAMIRGFANLRLSKIASASLATYGVGAALSVHVTPRIIPKALVDHNDIMDAFRFIEGLRLADDGTEAAKLRDPREVHIDKLTALLVEAQASADRVPALEQGLAEKDAHIDKLTVLLVEAQASADRIPALEQGLAEKDAHIDELTVLLVEAQASADRIPAFEQGLAEKDARIDKPNALLAHSLRRLGCVFVTGGRRFIARLIRYAGR